MTTPAASAWHRRRAVLSAPPAPRVRSVQHAASLEARALRRASPRHAPSAAAPASALRASSPLLRALHAALQRASAASWHALLLCVGVLALSRSAACERRWGASVLALLAVLPCVAVCVAAFVALARLRPIGRRTHLVLFALGSVSFLVIHSVLHAFITFGPSLSRVCTSRLLPSWSQLLPQLLLSLQSALVHACFVAEAQCTLVYLQPFPGVYNSLRTLAPRVLVLSLLPPLVASAPSLLVTLFVLPRALHALWTVVCAMQCTAACLFIWNVLQTLSSVPKRVSVEEARVMTAQFGKPGMIPSASMIDALDALSRQDTQLSTFVAFTDASGEAWRSTLNVLLAPLSRVQAVLSAQNASGKPALLVRSSTGGAATASVANLDDEAVRQAVAACKTIARLFVKSYSVDVYGVVQRTLPATLVCVLKLKEEIGVWLRQPRYRVEGALSALGVAEWVGVASQRRLVEVVDDELVRCVYTIVGRFDKFLKSFLSGKEYEWDGSVNECLDAFLRYDVP